MASKNKKSSVLLLKAEQLAVHSTSVSDKYVEVFKTHNFTFDVVPVIDFDFHHIDELSEKLKHPENYAGIIFVSPRTVKAAALAMGDGLNPEWKILPSFAIGERSAEIAKVVLGLDCQGSSSDCGYQLAKFISENSEKLNGKPLLFPHGNLRSDSVLDNLKAEGLTVECIEVYITKQHADLEKNLLDVFSRRKVNVVICFSPSGVNFALPILKEHIKSIHTVKFLAIGKTTEEALRSKGFSVSGTALRPNPNSVAQQLENILR